MRAAKGLLSLLAVVLLCAAFAVPAFAQSAEAEKEWQHILEKHPRLRADPSLVNNQAWLKSEPGVAAWLRHHTRIRAEAAREGAWDKRGTWRNPEWWHQNDPDWMRENHPEWARSHPEWPEYRESAEQPGQRRGHRHDRRRHEAGDEDRPHGHRQDRDRGHNHDRD